MPAVNAAESAGVISTQAPAETVSMAPEPQTETQTASTSSLMDKLGLPAEVQKELREKQEQEQEQPETPAAEVPIAEAEPVESPETPQAENPQEEQHKPKDDWPESAKERVSRLTRQKNELKEQKEDAEAQIAALQAQLEGSQSITVAPTPGDVLANIHSEDQLTAVVQEAKLVRDFYRGRLQGYVENEGKENERMVPPEEVAQYLGQAEDIINEHVPRKFHQLQERRQVDQIARVEHPTIFDQKTQDYQVAVALQRQLPGLVNHPAKHLILGDYIVGVKVRLAKGKNGKTNTDIPPELLRLTAPIAPHVPSAQRGGDAQPSRKRVEQAMNQVAQSDGGRDAIKAGLRAIREARAKERNPQSLVSV